MAYDKLLSGFLQWLRKSKGVKTYIWKAELQQRGQIHYHITLPDFIHYLEIRNEWNKLQKAAGLLDEYAKEHGHFNPNSTDIHDVRHVKNMSSYIVKELGKSIDGKKHHFKNVVDSLIKAGEISEDQREKVLEEYVGVELATEGKIWDCSNNLSGCRYYSVVMTSRHEDLIAQLIAAGDCRKVSGDWWAIMYFNDTSPPDLLSKEERAKFEEHVGNIINQECLIEDQNILPFIPVELVNAEVDVMQTFSIEQMQLNFN